MDVKNSLICDVEYLIMLGWSILLRIDIYLMALMGMPSSSAVNFIFFNALIDWASWSKTLVTDPYDPSPTFFIFSYLCLDAYFYFSFI